VEHQAGARRNSRRDESTFCDVDLSDARTGDPRCMRPCGAEWCRVAKSHSRALSGGYGRTHWVAQASCQADRLGTAVNVSEAVSTPRAFLMATSAEEKVVEHPTRSTVNVGVFRVGTACEAPAMAFGLRCPIMRSRNPMSSAKTWDTVLQLPTHTTAWPFRRHDS